MSEVVLKELAVVFGAAGCADGAAKVAVELKGSERRVGLWMKGVDVYDLALLAVLVPCSWVVNALLCVMTLDR